VAISNIVWLVFVGAVIWFGGPFLLMLIGALLGGVLAAFGDPEMRLALAWVVTGIFGLLCAWSFWAGFIEPRQCAGRLRAERAEDDRRRADWIERNGAQHYEGQWGNG
jgi:hypothetical protein